MTKPRITIERESFAVDGPLGPLGRVTVKGGQFEAVLADGRSLGCWTNAQAAANSIWQESYRDLIERA